jgi:hypothetical protein
MAILKAALLSIKPVLAFPELTERNWTILYLSNGKVRKYIIMKVLQQKLVLPC